MFIGHFGLGFAGKKFSKTASLGTYFMSAQWIDLIWPILLLLGREKVEIKPGVSSVTPEILHTIHLLTVYLGFLSGKYYSVLFIIC